MISEKRIKELQVIMKEEHSQELTWAEASEAAHNLVGFAEVLYNIGKREFELTNRLKENPEGFHMPEGTFSCCICSGQVAGENSWYDANGIKCVNCQRALNEGLIPASVCKNDDS